MIGDAIILIECGMAYCPLGSSRSNLSSIVLSLSHLLSDISPYHLSSLSTGLLYLAPFIGGVLGSSIAGKCSDIVCRWMTRRNGGVFEPEFRLVMVVLVAFSTVLGLWGFGWSAQVQDPWIAPTVFFGVIGTLPLAINIPSIIFCCMRGVTVANGDRFRLHSGLDSKHILRRRLLSRRRRLLLDLPKLF